MSVRARAGDRRTVLLAVAAILLAVVAAVASPSTFGAFTTSVTTKTNTAASAVFGPTTCREAVTGPGSTALFAYPLSEDSRFDPVVDATGNGRTGDYINNAFFFSGFNFNQAGPCPRDPGGAVTLNSNVSSTRSYITGPSATTQGPDTFSVSIWFRTTSSRGGRLIGFGNYGNGAGSESTLYDRHLYLDTSGRLVFGVYPNNRLGVLTSPTALDDGAWHQAVGTLQSGTSGTRGLRLYIDGQLVGTDLSTTSAQSYAGRWRLGGDNLATWPGAPSNEYYQGSLAWASVHSTALTAEQVRVSYAAGR